MRTRITRLSTLALMLMIGACSVLGGGDPLKVEVAGLEPSQGAGMEMRMGLKLRVQNPNDKPVEFTGTALSLEVNGRELASGVSGEGGTVPRYGETVITVPVTLSVMSMAKQALGMVSGGSLKAIPYKLKGKLEGGAFGTHRFSSEGKLDLSAAMPGS